MLRKALFFMCITPFVSEPRWLVAKTIRCGRISTDVLRRGEKEHRNASDCFQRIVDAKLPCAGILHFS